MFPMAVDAKGIVKALDFRKVLEVMLVVLVPLMLVMVMTVIVMVMVEMMNRWEQLLFVKH